jgi:diadenylate cyclase
LIETGVKLQAEVTSELLVSIFAPRTPLHDGAVIIGNDLILAAKCILPLTQNPDIERAMGTRHRAALGITEESDAVAVVVSEETGKISLAYGGEYLHRNLDKENLKKSLTKILEESRQKTDTTIKPEL